MLGVLLTLSLVATAYADIGNFDDYWKSRAAKAEKAAAKAFDPNPENVTDILNAEVEQ